MLGLLINFAKYLRSKLIPAMAGEVYS